MALLVNRKTIKMLITVPMNYSDSSSDHKKTFP